METARGWVGVDGARPAMTVASFINAYVSRRRHAVITVVDDLFAATLTAPRR